MNMRALKNIALISVVSTFPTLFSFEINGPVRSDTTIRPFGAISDTHCIYKRYLGYTSGQDLWVWPCDVGSANVNAAGKYQWNYNSTSGLVKSIGSEIKNPDQPFCWNIVDPSRAWTQRVKIDVCDENNANQKFDFIDGRIQARTGDPVLCVGWEVSRDADLKTPLITTKCFSNNFAEVADSPPPTTTEAPTTPYTGGPVTAELCSAKNHPDFGNNPLQVASFNIQIFGDTKVGKASVANTLVDIFNMFDLVAVQEIRDSDLSGIDTFMNTYRG